MEIDHLDDHLPGFSAAYARITDEDTVRKHRAVTAKAVAVAVLIVRAFENLNNKRIGD
jgi:hypothetical protein